jgi:subtilisin family serine protease
VDASQDVSDREEHGTGSASVIWTMASAVTILPLKVTKNGVATHAHINAAVVYAIKSGAEIINLSIGFEIKNLEAIKKLVTTEEFDRTLFVTAAGNQGRYIAQTISENTLIVGATPLDLPIRAATYSDWGPGVEIAAPAGSSDDGITVFRSFRPLAYRRFNGTSAAAPVVTGAAVLMKQMNPNLNGKELKQAILESAVVEPGLEGRVGNSKFLSLH